MYEEDIHYNNFLNNKNNDSKEIIKYSINFNKVPPKFRGDFFCIIIGLK